nr:hypothetical protein [uncultured Roseateles sp.]
MTKLTHEERLQKALQAKAKAEQKLKRLAEAETKRKLERLQRIADKTGMLEIADEALIPELRSLVERLVAAAAKEAQQ